MYNCKWCGKEFDDKRKLAGHSTFCKKNPKYKNNISILNSNRKLVKQQDFYCTYCNKAIRNKGCLVLHETHCYNNPNRLITKTSLLKEDRNNRRDDNGKVTWSRKHSDETKQKISNKRKIWLTNNKDKHVWKRNSKFISVPCENLKLYLKSNNINFVEEYTPFDDLNYSLDIAFPDTKIAIEVNGNQHYNNDGTLKDYYQNRHTILENRGWKIFEVHYTKCYKIKIHTISDILNLEEYDIVYVKNFLEKFGK